MRTLLIAVPGDDSRFENTLALDTIVLLERLDKENGRRRTALVPTYWSLLLCESNQTTNVPSIY